MTLRIACLFAVAAALPVAAWSQAFPSASPSVWPGATGSATGPGFDIRTLSPAPQVSARTPSLSPNGSVGLKSEETSGSQPTWKVTTIERVLLDAAITRARTRGPRRGNSSGRACLVDGAEAFGGDTSPVGLQHLN